VKGQDFANVYFQRDGNRQAFLFVGKLLTSSRYQGQDEYDIFMPGARNPIINTEGGIPAIVTRIRFMNAIAKAGDNEPRVFCLLNQILTEDAIHELFPEVWLQWHNYMARRDANRTINQLRHERKDKVHMEVKRLTTNGSVRKFLKD